MIENFYCLSLSHQRAALDIREMFTLNEEQQKSFSIKVKDYFAISDLLLLSTCNRTEIYFTSEKDISFDIIKTLTAEKVLLNYVDYFSYFQTFKGIEAVEHIFNVASGLNSKIIGDLQIANQIKNAYQIAVDTHMAGPFLHRLMHTIFYANKRIVNETAFRDGTATVTYHAYTLASELIANISKPKILVLGLGEIGLTLCKYLAESNFDQITIMTRTQTKAESLALEFGFKYAPIEDLENQISDADIILSSIRKDSPIISLSSFSKKPINAYKYLIDLSVPRSILPEVENLAGVLLYNIESIQTKVNNALALRLAAVPDVENIIRESIASFLDWSEENLISPTIIKFKSALNTIRKEEISRYLKVMTAEEAEKIDKITQSIIQKIIKLPIINLKSSCKRGDTTAMIDVLNQLFDLENQEVSK
jgi:glutamyl-tRNA reductase